MPRLTSSNGSVSAMNNCGVVYNKRTARAFTHVCAPARQQEMPVLTRIVAITDAYDNMATPRHGRRAVFVYQAPAQALHSENTGHNPVLACASVRMMRQYA